MVCAIGRGGVCEDEGVNVHIRHHVEETGPPTGPVVVLAHGFGCDQHMWRLVAPRLAETFRVVTFDFVGSGRSDRSAWDAQRYSSLDGYAQDVDAAAAEDAKQQQRGDR